mmetsp:Transcript_11885/g.30004  ORF Transcript_11885/g.30004 Transcript_11885/m.30004 type:complete len:102 (+) Transcript_11885:40-345(+)
MSLIQVISGFFQPRSGKKHFNYFDGRWEGISQCPNEVLRAVVRRLRMIEMTIWPFFSLFLRSPDPYCIELSILAGAGNQFASFSRKIFRSLSRVVRTYRNR